MDEGSYSDEPVLLEKLTWREQEILALLAERLTNREIADRLHLAESTVKDYVGNILAKLDVKNRRQAVEHAKALGLFDSDQITAAESKTNLPPERTPFVGRKNELSEIQRLLGKTRLLTLIGPGGIGKTRLAIKTAEMVMKSYKDGVFFISLAPINSAKDMVQTIAEGLKFPLATHEDPQNQLLRYLHKKELLLVMDNFEHLLDGAGIVSEILQAAPAITVLATSRERLNLQSETLLHVGGMALPEEIEITDILSNDSISLFIQSADKVRARFDPTPSELQRLIEICQIVGGMPLAIELAAAWLHMLNVDEIADELQKDLDILAADVRDAPARHRSIRAVFDHSWSLLDQAERETFMRLSVFQGGFTREAAQQVTGASLQVLLGLVDKSFLSHDPDSGRLEMHELLRQYGEEHLEEKPQASRTAHEAHASYYADFMEEQWEKLKGSLQMQAQKEIEADVENVRAAWHFSLDQTNTQQIWKFIYGLWHFHWMRSWNHAGAELFSEAAEAIQDVDDETKSLEALATALKAYFMAWLGIPESGIELATKNVRVLRKLNHPKALFFAYYAVIINAYFLSRITEMGDAVNHLEQLAVQVDDKWLIAYSLFAPSMIALISGEYDKAQRLAEYNLKICEQLGDEIGSTMPMTILGHVALARQDYAAAREFYLRSLKLARRTSFVYSQQTTSKYMAKVSLLMNDYKEAKKYLIQCLALTKEVGFIRDVVNLLYEYTRLMTAQNKPEEAVRLLSLIIDHPTSNQIRWLEGRIDDSAKQLLNEIKEDLSPQAYSAALEDSQNLDLDEVVARLIE
jgi:predicted ATPase/DNA-binding CsgD family transcriptional regulator